MALKRNTRPLPIFSPLLRLHPQHLERRRSGSGVINPGIIHPPSAPRREPPEAGLERVISESAARLSPAGRTLGSFQPQKLRAPAYRDFFRAEKSSRALLTSFLLHCEGSLSLGAAGRAMPRSRGRKQGRCGCPAGRARAEAGISALVPGAGSRWGRPPPPPPTPPLLLLLGWGLLSASAAAGKSGRAGEPAAAARPTRAPSPPIHDPVPVPSPRPPP